MHAERSARRSTTFILAAALVAQVAPGCSGSARQVQTGPARPGSANAVNGENYTDVLRELDENAPAPAQRPLRDATARYLARRGMEKMHDGDADGAVRALQTALVHYTPEEINRGGLPAELAPLARGVLELVAPRGDEARALAANRILQAVTPPDPEAAARFRRIHEWGERNRQEFRSPWAYRGEMADVYKEVARIVPARDVIDRASQYIVGRRQSAMEAREQAMPSRRLTMEDLQQLQAGLGNAAMDLAVLYLRLGDIAGAADRVSQLGSGGREGGVAAALRAIANGEGGADGLIELAAQLQRIDITAASAICRKGRREHPTDPRFAQCLGIAAAREGDPGLASAHLEAAARLQPSDARALRAALAASIEWFESEQTNEDPAPGRAALVRARALYTEWNRAFPREPLPFSASELDELAARLELAQGNLPGAQQFLSRATQARPPSRDAFATLAEIAWRKNDPRRAIELLERGIALPLRPNESDSTFRPDFKLRIGRAAHAAGDETASRRSLEEALAALDALTRSLEGTPRAQAYFLHAVALDALGREADVRRSLDAAINAAPESKDLAAQIVTFSLGRGRFRDALEIGRAARGRLTLDRTWKVYFGLWGVIAARMSGAESDGGARESLEDIARTAGPHAPWIVRLAQRYAGTMDREALLREAGDAPTHRAEAYFYEAMLELVSGDREGAERDLRVVLATDMLRFFEYDMAWEMLARGLPALQRAAERAQSTTAAATGTAPVTAAPATAR